MSMSEIPAIIAQFLGPNTALMDHSCGEPVGWGHPVIAHMGEELWAEAQKYGTMQWSEGKWFLITKSLTREEAATLYGPITEEVYGPRGGWKSVTFGSKQFLSKSLKPIKV